MRCVAGLLDPMAANALVIDQEKGRWNGMRGKGNKICDWCYERSKNEWRANRVSSDEWVKGSIYDDVSLQ